MVIIWVLWIIVVYLILVFIIPLFFFPNYLIFKTNIVMTKKIKKVATRLKRKNKEETLRKVFNYVTKNYSSEKPYLFILLYKHFYHDVNNLIDKKQFLPCHVQSLVFRTLLLATGQFSETLLKKKIVITWFGVIHQYYLVKIDKKIFKADLFFEILEEKK